MKNASDPSRIEAADFRLVLQCLNLWRPPQTK